MVHNLVHKFNTMLVVSSRTFRDYQKKYLDLATKERVIIKRKVGFFELVPRGESIPDNPSPSNDPYWDDPRNIAELKRSMKEADSGEFITLHKEDIDKFLGI